MHLPVRSQSNVQQSRLGDRRIRLGSTPHGSGECRREFCLQWASQRSRKRCRDVLPVSIDQGASDYRWASFRVAELVSQVYDFEAELLCGRELCVDWKRTIPRKRTRAEPLEVSANAGR